jgi:16S rRNA (cytosine1402-N4)-methyltransferase
MHQNKHQNTDTAHIPVLREEVMAMLAPRDGETYLDLTGGYGGHASEVLEATGNYAGSVLVDRDGQAVNELRRRFGDSGVDIRHADFLTASRELLGEGRQFDLILADLGVSSPHLNVGARGFAIQADGPLDMRMDQSQALDADKIVNGYSETGLAELIAKYGEEPKAKQIARLIARSRPIHSTTELAQAISRAWPGRSRVHPATRTFQAIRIAVNDELNLLEASLPIWVQLLKPGGRLAVISFHSLEDRVVKQALRAVSGDRFDADLRLLTKRPMTVSPSELVHNPRARSAKLRAAVKINTKERELENANSGKK